MSGMLDAGRNGLKLLKRGDDDSFDRLSSRYSVGICLLFAFLISGGQYFGDPIDCWSPNEFSKQWMKYVDQYCWVKNTYYVSHDEAIPEHSQRIATEIKYYQWAPIIVAFQAFVFALPALFWKAVSSGAGFNVDSIVKKCQDSKNIDPSEWDKTMKYLTDHLDRLLDFRRNYMPGNARSIPNRIDPHSRWLPAKRKGNYLVYLYMVTKLFYIGAAVFQLQALNYIIGEDFHLFGIRALRSLLTDAPAPPATFFPLITLCDFSIRRLGSNLHTYTVQCVLPWNLFNEKIYIFLWWWLVFVTAMSAVGFILWFITLLPSRSNKFIKSYLKLAKDLDKKDIGLIDEFTSKYLKRDGTFVLRMISKHVGDMFTAQLIISLWRNFVDYRSESLDSLPQKDGDESSV